MVGFIGHELRHALEVLQDRSVRDDPAVANFFDRFARTNTTGLFETDDVEAIGDAVEKEVCRKVE